MTNFTETCNVIENYYQHIEHRDGDEYFTEKNIETTKVFAEAEIPDIEGERYIFSIHAEGQLFEIVSQMKGESKRSTVTNNNYWITALADGTDIDTEDSTWAIPDCDCMCDTIKKAIWCLDNDMKSVEAAMDDDRNAGEWEREE